MSTHAESVIMIYELNKVFPQRVRSIAQDVLKEQFLLRKKKATCYYKQSAQ